MEGRMVRYVGWPDKMIHGGKSIGKLPWYTELEIDLISCEILADAGEIGMQKMQFGLDEVDALATYVLDAGDYQRYNFRNPRKRRQTAPLDVVVRDKRKNTRGGGNSNRNES